MTRHPQTGCRRGLVRAAMLLSLTMPAAALAQSGVTTQKEPPATRKTDLPAAADLFARHVEALGGEQALRKLTSMHMTGQFEMPAGGIDAEMHVYQHAPNKTLVVIDIPGMGVIRRGFDGNVGWSLNPMEGPSLIEGKELAEIVEESDFYGELNYKKRYKSMETVDRKEFNGVTCHVVEAVTQTDMPRTIFFDVESGLQVGQEAMTETQMGSLKAITLMNDYKQFGDIRMPAKVVTKLPDVGMEQFFTITAVDFNKTPASEFKLPEEIQVLLKSRDDKPTTRPAKGSGTPESDG
ncbi:MAG: hypothetical protein ACYTGG_06860 [Planctomycetota bacterium]|jgi:hypothetical protein